MQRSSYVQKTALVTGALLFSQSALARGGGGAALATLAEIVMGLAMIGGLIFGLCVRKLRSLALKLSVLSVLGAPILLVPMGLIVLPVLAFAAIAWATMIVVAGTSINPRHAVSQPDTSSDDALRNGGPFTAAIRWVSATYLFWAAFSLTNLGFLAGLVVPPLAITHPAFYLKFMPFVFPPLLFSLALSVVAGYVLCNWKPHVDHRLKALITNALLLVAFLFSAEMYREHLVNKSLYGRTPDCMRSYSFMSSLSMAGNEWRFHRHVWYEIDGIRYYWSYSEKRMVQFGDVMPVEWRCRG